MFNVINKFVNNNVGLSKSFLNASSYGLSTLKILETIYMVDEYMQ